MFIQTFARILSSKSFVFFIQENTILKFEPIDQKTILQVQHHLSTKDSLIITQVIFSTLKELCLLVKNSYLLSIFDSEIINLVNDTLIIWDIRRTTKSGTKPNDRKLKSGKNKAGKAKIKIGEITIIAFNIDILYSPLNSLS
ncbi:MAG: hypothetical protein LBC61_00985 [Candidatus Peribacteria bacterium]|nr:hypothetical protein [Candidatus Peribacteria bacterium]